MTILHFKVKNYNKNYDMETRFSGNKVLTNIGTQILQILPTVENYDGFD